MRLHTLQRMAYAYEQQCLRESSASERGRANLCNPSAAHHLSPCFRTSRYLSTCPLLYPRALLTHQVDWWCDTLPQWSRQWIRFGYCGTGKRPYCRTHGARYWGDRRHSCYCQGLWQSSTGHRCEANVWSSHTHSYGEDHTLFLSYPCA